MLDICVSVRRLNTAMEDNTAMAQIVVFRVSVFTNTL